jgi:FKBP-type peptidyl-prolyl cis-trans isomerase
LHRAFAVSCVLALACQPAVAPVAEVPVLASSEPAALPSSLPAASATPAASAAPEPPSHRVLPSGLEIDVLRPGVGKEATAGNRVKVHYVGTLEDGRRFDSSRDRGKPFSFELGAGNVIKGWDEGVAGMREGELRRLRIPPELAYGARGAPPKIGPDATLLFEVELLEVH